MKVLLDTCVWGGARDVLVRAGLDAIWTGDWELDPGDEKILLHAINEKRILVTLDKDFGELAIVHGMKHFGIIRLVNISARQQAATCVRVIELHGAELLRGAIITAESGRLRIRPAEN